MAPSSPLAAFTLDDFESRSASATSILRTITGLYLRHARGAVTRTRVIELATAAGLRQPAAQTAITRLVDRGLLQVSGPGQLQVSQPALAMFARGNRRIFTPRQMEDTDPWVLVTYSLPESMRSVRHQLRKHFTQIGGGLVGPGLWIFPRYLRAEVTEVLEALGVRHNATLFVTDRPEFAISPLESAHAWWDLERLAERHREFIERVEDLPAAGEYPAAAYRSYVTLVDAWRAIPYLDPGLPPSMLPANWPGQVSRELFLGFSRTLREPARWFAGRLIELLDESAPQVAGR